MKLFLKWLAALIVFGFLLCCIAAAATERTLGELLCLAGVEVGTRVGGIVGVILLFVISPVLSL